MRRGWSDASRTWQTERNDPVLMWQFKEWRCQYEPDSQLTGRLVVYIGAEAIVDVKSSAGPDAQARALRLREIAYLTHLRSQGRLRTSAWAGTLASRGERGARQQPSRSAGAEQIRSATDK
jgi:hypothetical protein